MSTRHVAHAVAATAASAPRWRIELRTGMHRLVADERTPVTLAVRAGTPITTRVVATDSTKPASGTDT
jgi:hypothetical protein